MWLVVDLAERVAVCNSTGALLEGRNLLMAE